MRVLLAVGWYFPDSVGGTEVYVRGLARHLARDGADVSIAAPSADAAASTYDHDGIAVHRYPAPYADDALAGWMTAEPGGWCDLIERHRPDIVDVHSVTSALGLPHLAAARRRGIRTVLTAHLPGVVCARGTLMRFGHTPCDGALATQPCEVCRLHGRGVPRAAGRVLERLPGGLHARGLDRRLPVFLKSLFGPSVNHARRRRLFADLMSEADRVVAVSAWLARMLELNGVPPAKVSLCRQGVDGPFVRRDGDRRPGPLRAGFVGRLDPLKGLHVLLEAERLVADDVPLELHIWGAAAQVHPQYSARVLARARLRSRVTVHPETRDVRSVYADLDVLVVPSQWLETGPIVVLEAQAAGLPVVGSDLGGITERVTDDTDGLLVPANEPAAFAAVLARLAGDPALVRRLRHTAPVRTMAEVACDTLRTYRGLVERRRAS
ncbi:MAG TPA: glycosyltransferase [Vicinamibacterales bacterium]